jgi:hypothetical protein
MRRIYDSYDRSLGDTQASSASSGEQQVSSLLLRDVVIGLLTALVLMVVLTMTFYGTVLYGKSETASIARQRVLKCASVAA